MEFSDNHKVQLSREISKEEFDRLESLSQELSVTDVGKVRHKAVKDILNEVVEYKKYLNLILLKYWMLYV